MYHFVTNAFVHTDSHVTSETWDWQGDDCSLEDNMNIGASAYPTYPSLMIFEESYL